MKLIVFDIDGTLTDTKEVDDDCFIRAFDTVFGIDLTHQNWAEITNVTDWGITEEIINNHWKRNPTSLEYEKMHAAHIHNLALAKSNDIQQFQEVDGAKQFFYYLQTVPEYKLGVATGAWQASALIKLNAIGINPLDFPFSNSDYHKTREAITLHTVEQAKTSYGFDFQDIIYFGDGEWDFKTCKNLGIPFIGIDITNNNKLKLLGAKNVFQNYLNPSEILNILQG